MLQKEYSRTLDLIIKVTYKLQQKKHLIIQIRIEFSNFFDIISDVLQIDKNV